MALFYVYVAYLLSKSSCMLTNGTRSEGLPIGWMAIMLALLASMGGFIFGVSADSLVKFERAAHWSTV